MKSILVVLSVLSALCYKQAFATEGSASYSNAYTESNSESYSNAYAGSNSSATGAASSSVGNTNVTIQDRLQIPGGSGNLGAVSTNNTVNHRYVESNGVSIVFGLFTLNGTRSKFDLSSFLITNPVLTPRQELSLCVTSQDFRVLRELEGNKCPALSTTTSKPLGQ